MAIKMKEDNNGADSAHDDLGASNHCVGTGDGYAGVEVFRGWCVALWSVVAIDHGFIDICLRDKWEL